MSWYKFLEQTEFHSYSGQHFWPIFLIMSFGFIYCIYAKRNWNSNQIKIGGTLLALIPLVAIIFRMIMIALAGEFDIKTDLPCHLCNIVAIMAPFVMWYRNRFWLGLFYFWVFVGTLNANLTPDVEYGFPHYTYFTYWLLHTGLLLLPLYAIFNYGLKINWKDFKNALLGINGLLVMSLIINFSIGSNYFYSRQKPEVASILDLLGPWPWYLITGQFLAVILCFIALLPWLIRKKASK